MASLVQRITDASFSPFTKKVWLSMLRIPGGKVSTYQLVARAAGNPKASRAVGNACNANPFAPMVPCHRVVSSDGKIGGYAKGLPTKIRLLEKEKVGVQNNKIVDFESKLFEF